MTNSISINEERLHQVLNEIRSGGVYSVLTTDIIEKYMGGFHINKQVPVNDSWNAQFGKYLKSHAAMLGILEETANEKVIINNNPTSASRWVLNN